MHVSIQSQKDFFRQICRTAGHAEQTSSGRCSRCKKMLRKGFVIYEQVGVVVYNAKGVTKTFIDS